MRVFTLSEWLYAVEMHTSTNFTDTYWNTWSASSPWRTWKTSITLKAVGVSVSAYYRLLFGRILANYKLVITKQWFY